MEKICYERHQKNRAIDQEIKAGRKGLEKNGNRGEQDYVNVSLDRVREQNRFFSYAKRHAIRSQPPKSVATPKCPVSLTTVLSKIYLKRLVISYLELLTMNIGIFNESYSAFIYDEILSFLDRQNHLSLELNRHSSRIHQMLGITSSIRLYESAESSKRVR